MNIRFATAVPSQYHRITGEYVSGTECGHRHRTFNTALTCSNHRNQTQAPRTLIVEVVVIENNGGIRKLTRAEMEQHDPECTTY